MSRNDKIRDEAQRRLNAWAGPQSENSGTNSLVIQTPTNNNSAATNSSSNNGGMHPMMMSGRPNSGYGPAHQQQLTSSYNASGGGGGGGQQLMPQPTLDGPLPKEARVLIHSAVQGEEAEQAEVYARRLLSTSRRVRIYKEELQAAREEVDDYKTLVTQKQLIVNNLGDEAARIQAEIAALQNELHLAQSQQETVIAEQRRLEGKQYDAQRRVEALQSTIDTIANESQRGKLLLRQLVPNLNIDNYAN